MTEEIGMTNMDIWNNLEKTDPRYVKAFSKGGGFSGTAINPTYVCKRLTDVFGPCGIGWKIVLDDEKYIEGNELFKDDKPLGAKAMLHVVRGHMEYCIDGTWYATGPQFGQTHIIGANKYGIYFDEEAPKKSMTDLTTKLAVLLGCAADIHMGLWDDNKYVNDRKAEVEKEEEKDNKKAAKVLADAVIKLIEAANTTDELDVVVDQEKATMVEVKGLSNADYLRITQAGKAKRAALEQPDVTLPSS